MSLDDWVLALHLLAAFALVGAMVVLWIVVAALRSADRPSRVLMLAPLLRLSGVAVVVGSLGTIVFGVWLAISLDAYHPWDGWVIAAIVFWAIAGATGNRVDPEYRRAFTRARELAGQGDEPSEELAALCRPAAGLLLHTIASAAVILILVDMIWKPGA
jgi:hypothetical protein